MPPGSLGSAIVIGVFLAVAAVVAFIGFRLEGRWRPDPNARAAAARPSNVSAAGKPWLARKDWAAGVMRDSPTRHLDVYVLAVLGPALLAFAVAFWLHPPAGQGSGWGLYLPVAISGPLGAGLTLRAFHLLMTRVRYGVSQLRLETMPIPLGGALRAELKAGGFRAGQGTSLRVRLKCMRAVVKQDYSLDYTPPRAEGQHVEHNVVWEDEDFFTADDRGLVKIAFPIPADGLATTPATGSSWRYWNLEIEDSRGRAGGYRAEFEVPVFQTLLTAREAADAAALVEARRRKLETLAPEPWFRVRVAPTRDGGTEFLLPPVGVAGGAISQSIIVLVSAGLLYAAYGQTPAITTIGWGIRIALLFGWGLLTVLLFIWVLRLWLTPERIVVGRDAIRVTSGLFGITQTMPHDQVQRIHAVRITLPYLVSVHVRGPGWWMIGAGQGIRENQEAQWLAQQMSRAAGIEPSSPIPVNEQKEVRETISALAKDFTPTGATTPQFTVKRLMELLRQREKPRDG
jgi:hypothetical protein